MTRKKRLNQFLDAPASLNIAELLAAWGKKAFDGLKNHTLPVMTRRSEPMGPALASEEWRFLKEIVCQRSGIDEGLAHFDASFMGDLALLQANRIHQALIDDFGLTSGLAAPEVIVLDLYPQSYFASLEAVRLACSELIAVGGDVLSDDIARMLKNKFWAVGENGLDALSSVLPVDFQAAFCHEVEFERETHRIFDISPATNVARRFKADTPGEPVLVILALFPEIQSLHGKNSQADDQGEATSVIMRNNKPFTRHDTSMLIFNVVEDLLLACGQGVASVAAPAELCRAPEAVGLRKRWLKELDRVYVDAMADTALYQLLKLPRDRIPRYGRGEGAAVLYKRDDHATHCGVLVGSMPTPLKNADDSYQNASPHALNKYSLIPPRVSEEYNSWASVVDIARVEPSNGLMEKRGGALIDIDGEVLERRMRAYLDRDLPWRDYMELGLGLTGTHSSFKPEEARQYILQQTSYDRQNIKPYAFKPFDARYCYYSSVTPLWNDPRPELVRQCRPDNRFIITRPAAAIEPEGVPFFLTGSLTDGDLLRGHAYCIPFWLYGENDGQPQPNLSHAILEYLRILQLSEVNEPGQLAQLVWRHVLAIGFSPAYLAGNAEALQQEWPRIPLPMPNSDSKHSVENAGALLLRSAVLGGKIAALLAPENDSPLSFITETADSYGEIGPLFFWNSENHVAEPFSCDSIALNAHWGYTKVRRKQKAKGQEQGPDQERDHESGRNVMPGNGRLFRRGYNNAERRALEDMGLGMGLHAGAVYAALGHDTCDIYLDRDVYWRNVPSNIWEYRIGGYPVLKKWLSYREHAILGRNLRQEEVRYFTEMVHRLTAIRLLESELDRNFALVRDQGGDPTKQGKIQK